MILRTGKQTIKHKFDIVERVSLIDKEHGFWNSLWCIDSQTAIENLFTNERGKPTYYCVIDRKIILNCPADSKYELKIFGLKRSVL